MFSHLCRICMTQLTDRLSIVPLFETYENVFFYRICNEMHFPPMQKDDNLGENICKSCSETLVKFHNFRLMCRESHEKLRKMLVAETNGSLVVSSVDSSKKSDATDIRMMKNGKKNTKRERRKDIEKANSITSRAARKTLKFAKNPRPVRYELDCTNIANSINIHHFRGFLLSRVKEDVNFHTRFESLTIERQNMKLFVSCDLHFSKKYLKFLSRNYLKGRRRLKCIDVVDNGQDSFQLKYNNISTAREQKKILENERIVQNNEIVDEPVNKTVDKPVNETVDEAVDETIDDPTDEPVDETDDSTDDVILVEDVKSVIEIDD